MENKICIEFLWLPTENELPILKPIHKFTDLKKLPPVLEKLKAFLKKLLNLSLTIKHVKSKINYENSADSSSMFFSEYLFTVTCMLELDSNSDSKKLNFYKKLIDKFCNGNLLTSFPELYLNIDFSVLIKNPLRTDDNFICLEGFSLGNIVKLNKFVEHFSSDDSLNSYNYKITQVKVKFLHDEEKMFVNFIVGCSKVKAKNRSPKTHRMFSLEIPYSALHTIIICSIKPFLVYFRLYTPPLLYGVKQDEDNDSYVSYMDLSSATRWIRSVNLFKDCPPHIRKQFTMNTVLCLKFQDEDFEMLKIIYRHKSIQVYFAYVNVVPYSDVHITMEIKDFECYYAYQCLITHSYELFDQLMSREELEKFKNIMKENAEKEENCKVLSNALYNIYSAISKCNIVIINYSIKFLLENMLPISNDNVFLKQKNIVLVKRAIIIPTHVRFLPPHPILRSRALRQCDPNYSLRLSIRDVNLGTINFSFKGFTERKTYLKEFYETYYVKNLLKGIKIRERIYKYVGSSTSQLKGHGLWFYAEDENGLTANKFREKLGNMDDIKEVPKYMARMGQTFSQSLGRIKVPQEYTNVDSPEEDITGGVKKYLLEDSDDINKKYLVADDNNSENESEDDPYTFSDGIGRISLDIIKEVQERLKLDKLPVAMQIRYAGCKGMLVLDPNLEGKRILFRKSMQKFKSKDDSLEIIKVNEPRVASLNRPLVTILEQLGVAKEVFIKLQKQMIQNHIKSMFYEPEACKFLQRNSKLRINFLKMHENGISFTEDPLFRSMIYALFKKQLELLKNKTNIEIPPDKGRAMFATLDETSTLEYGQVFIQYTRLDDKKQIVHIGTVVVTKNPCMHPGDVRKFEAVDVEKLHHIVDCIVFPAKGPRPHPDEMAGSDLDGDECHVMWYEPFIFERDNVEAMDYAMRKNKSLNQYCKIEPADELEHLGNYIINDNVGLIASAHLAFADKENKGIFSENCMCLARKYAIALDFAKSGKIAKKHKNDNVVSYPDFMQKFGEKNTYISKRALGVLYRNCRRLEIGLESTQSEISYRLDSDLVYENWNVYEESAKRVYQYYCCKIESLMNTYSFSTEGELLTGAFLNPPKYYEQRHDYDNLMPLIEYEIQWILKDLKNIFIKELKDRKKEIVWDNNFNEDMFQQASAWYVVTYNEERNTNNYSYFGLPWAVAEILIKLKQNNCSLKKGTTYNEKSVLEDVIDKRLSYPISSLSKNTPVNEIYENRLEVLSVAQTVLEKWLNTQKDHIMIEDLKKFKKIAQSKFETAASPLLSRDLQYIKQLKSTNNLKKAISPAYFIIETLLRLACMETLDLNKKFLVFDAKQEISLLSWVTLIKLACTYSPDYLGIGDISHGICLLPQDNVVSTFKLYLYQNNEYNEEFSRALLQDPNKVIKYLKSISKIHHVDLRYDIEKISEKKEKYVALFTVSGSRYTIEKLKDLVVQDDFYMWVIKNQKLFATQS